MRRETEMNDFMRFDVSMIYVLQSLTHDYPRCHIVQFLSNQRNPYAGIHCPSNTPVPDTF